MPYPPTRVFIEVALQLWAGQLLRDANVSTLKRERSLQLRQAQPRIKG